MDTKVAGKEVSQDLARGSLIAISHCVLPTLEVSQDLAQDLARESLIAISQCVPPDMMVASKLSSKSNGTNAVELKGNDTTENYRSKLISISYTDIKTSPTGIGEH